MRPEEYLTRSRDKQPITYRFFEMDRVSMDPMRHIIYSGNGYDDSFGVRIQGLSDTKYRKARKQGMRQDRNDLVITRLDDAFCVPTHTNFYHLIIDCLPRLWGAFSRPNQRIALCGNVLDELPQVFPAIRDWVPSAEWVLLERTSIKDEEGRITRLTPNRVEGDKLRFYSSDYPDHGHAFFDNKILAAAFWQKWFQDHHEPSKQTRKIFLARTVKPANARTSLRCINQEEVFGYLEPLGFEWVDPYDHDFVSMAKIMNAAHTVVGVHGAGLANTIFCQSGTKYVQLANSSGSCNIYERIALSLHCKYGVVYGHDPITKDPVTDNASGVFEISLENLRQALAQL